MCSYLERLSEYYSDARQSCRRNDYDTIDLGFGLVRNLILTLTRLMKINYSCLFLADSIRYIEILLQNKR